MPFALMYAARKYDKNEPIDSCNTSFNSQSQPIAVDLNGKQNTAGKIKLACFSFSNTEK